MTGLNINAIALDSSGRVVLTDDMLIALEQEATELVAGGDGWNTACWGGYNNCGNSFCGGSTNSGCTNTISCGSTTNVNGCR